MGTGKRVAMLAAAGLFTASGIAGAAPQRARAYTGKWTRPAEGPVGKRNTEPAIDTRAGNVALDQVGDVIIVTGSIIVYRAASGRIVMTNRPVVVRVGK